MWDGATDFAIAALAESPISACRIRSNAERHGREAAAPRTPCVLSSSIYYQPKPKAAPEAPPGPSAAPARSLSARDTATYIGMSDGWLEKKSRTKRGIGTDAPPFVRAGARRILYRRKGYPNKWVRTT